MACLQGEAIFGDEAFVVALTGKFGRILGYNKEWVPSGTNGYTSIEDALIDYWGT